MNYNFNFYSVVLLIFFTQGIVFSCLLLSRSIRENKYADKLLSLFVFLCSLYILPWMLGFAGWYFTQPYRDIMFYLPLQQVLLLGPLIYFYTQSLLDNSYRINKKDCFHFIPAVLYLGYSLVIWLTDKIILKQYYFYADGRDKDLDSWYQVAGLVSMTAYCIISVKDYSNYKRNLYDTVSFADNILFGWIQKYLIAFISMQILRVVFLIMYPDWGNFNAKGWYFLAFAVLFYYIAISAIISDNKSIVPIKLNIADASGNPITPDETAFKDEQLMVWKEKIACFIANSKSYENPELTLAELAKDLDTNPTALSKIINKSYRMNFNDYINNLRIEAIKEKLINKEYQKHTFLAIALDCGFNSKTTFNRAFKKNTLLTPKEFVALKIEKRN